MKPLNGGQGIGIFKLNAEDMNSVKICNYKEYIAEEILCQHEDMGKLNVSSVNTIRILSFKGEIVAAALRIGCGDCVVDNLHSKGICGHIDLDTGIIDGACINNELKKFTHHPISGVPLVGFKIPLWERIKETIIQATREVPQVEYIGWDVAVCRDKIALIEGNHDPGHDVVQMIAQTGIYEQIKKILKNRKCQ